MEQEFSTEKICPYCGTKFLPRRKNQTYCKETCRVYASQERHGKRIDYKKIATIGIVPVRTMAEIKASIESTREEIRAQLINVDSISDYNNNWGYEDYEYDEDYCNTYKAMKPQEKIIFRKQEADKTNALNLSLIRDLQELRFFDNPKGELKASEIREFKKYEKVYNFENFREDDCSKFTHLAGLRVQTQGFIFYQFTNMKDEDDKKYSRKDRHNYLLLLAKNLLKFMPDTLILFIGNNNDYDDLSDGFNKIGSDNITFATNTTRQAITYNIKDTKAEFVFFLDAEMSGITLDFLRTLQSINKKVSFVVSSEPKLKDILQAANIVINPYDEKMRNYDYGPEAINTGGKVPLWLD